MEDGDLSPGLSVAIEIVEEELAYATKVGMSIGIIAMLNEIIDSLYDRLEED